MKFQEGDIVSSLHGTIVKVTGPGAYEEAFTGRVLYIIEGDGLPKTSRTWREDSFELELNYKRSKKLKDL